jgi:endonuclease/exonuclease/phosphatase family metal-dependent hydrolase
MRTGIKMLLPFACWLGMLSCRTSYLAPEKTKGGAAMVKIMSYNIHHANPPSRVNFIDLDAVASVINREKPDLVAVQEVDVHTGRSGKNTSEAEVLADKTGLKAYFAKAIDYDGGAYGVLILSHFPIRKGRTYRLPAASGTHGEPRVLATTEVEIKDHKMIFACTHLDAQKTDTNRILQVSAIVEILKKEKRPVVIGGDFNAEAGGSVISVLDQHFTRTCLRDCGFTIPSEQPRKTIDFIACTPGAWIVKEHKVVSDPYASDHLPVIATLGLH